MGLSGLVGAGAQDAFAEMLARALLERQQGERERSAKAGEQIQRDRLAQDASQHAELLDLQHQSRRDRSNVAGIEQMDRQRGFMNDEAAHAEAQDRAKAAQRAVVNLSELAPMVDRSTPGGRREILGQLARIDPKAAAGEMLAPTPEEEEARSFDSWKKRQDYDENQIRTRPKEPKAQGPEGLTSAQGQTALKLQDDYARDSKPYLVVRDAMQRVQASAQNPDAAGDLSLIFAYMKILDPNSVVREQEFANAQNAAGVPDQVRNMYNRVMKGERLNPAQRTQFTQRAGEIFKNARTNHERVRRTYATRAQQWGIAPQMVLDEDDAPTPAPAAPDTDPLGIRRPK